MDDSSMNRGIRVSELKSRGMRWMRIGVPMCVWDDVKNELMCVGGMTTGGGVQLTACVCEMRLTDA